MSHRLIFTNNKPANLHGKYVVGSGVGSRNRSVYRALQNRANNNAAGQPCCIPSTNVDTDPTRNTEPTSDLPPINFSLISNSVNYTIPSGISSISITAAGGGGSNSGGGGGIVQTPVFSVTTGLILSITVGGAAQGTAGGYNGGADGNNSVGAFGEWYGGSGGGMTTITTSNNLLIVAGGGGGGTNTKSGGYGGGNGTATGGNGTNDQYQGGIGGNNGIGGFSSPDYGNNPYQYIGTNYSLGGNGGGNNVGYVAGGGAGYGGGGGGVVSAGGGGGSYSSITNSIYSYSTSVTDGSVIIKLYS